MGCNQIVPLFCVNSKQSAYLKIVEKTVYAPDVQPEEPFVELSHSKNQGKPGPILWNIFAFVRVTLQLH